MGKIIRSEILLIVGKKTEKVLIVRERTVSVNLSEHDNLLFYMLEKNVSMKIAKSF